MARERWDKRSAFLMAAIGSAIGLGNVWRFPYMAYSNGGGAFFIPYLIALFTTGIPLVTLEYYLGIRYQKGPTEVYGLTKKGTNYIGWFSLGITAMVTIYYAIVMAWTWNYLYYSFGVQWAGNEQSFFFNNVLNISKSIGDFGTISWPLALSNFLTWACIFLIIFKGLKVVGKVVAWSVGLPWVLLLILLIRGVTLEGAANGLNFYLEPNFAELLNPKVWLGAYGQIFYSLSLGFGIMIAYASYLPKDSDINTNAWVVSFANSATSFFAGFAVFSILGYLAFKTNVPVEEVIKSGPGLAFVIYPAAIATLPGGVWVQSLFGISFFVMLLTLGIDSAFSLVESIVTSLRDTFDINREKCVLVVCSIGFACGLFYSTSAGLYWLDVVDHWMNWGLVIIGLMEAILIGWYLDINAIIEDIDSTSSIKFGKFWVFCIKYLTPVVLFTTLASNMLEEIGSPYENYPIWALMSGGWVLLISMFYLSIGVQNRKTIFAYKHKLLRLIGWAFSYLGLIYSIYLFYTHSSKILAATLLVLASLIGLATVKLTGRSQKMEVSK